jgi:hypothetical protein
MANNNSEWPASLDGPSTSNSDAKLTASSINQFCFSTQIHHVENNHTTQVIDHHFTNHYPTQTLEHLDTNNYPAQTIEHLATNDNST